MCVLYLKVLFQNYHASTVRYSSVLHLLYIVFMYSISPLSSSFFILYFYITAKRTHLHDYDKNYVY